MCYYIYPYHFPNTEIRAAPIAESRFHSQRDTGGEFNMAVDGKRIAVRIMWYRDRVGSVTWGWWASSPGEFTPRCALPRRRYDSF